ncbi:hypothetical protein E4U54_006452 [Claviceps lovelessii]|nr:hypothetical protein E4U54_006452 [Claviceps lovelessii]
MYLPRSLFLLPFIAYTAAAAAAAATLEKRWPESNLTLELSSYVPVCAEDCFISFLQATFGLERGQRIPSLQELCSTDGETGFTVGEGAVQCIAAERSIDGCSDQDANSSVIYNAHQMCLDQPGAITPTHGVITATLVLPPSKGGPVSFPAPPSTPRTSKTSEASRTTEIDLPSTLVVDTHTLVRTTTSATAAAIATSSRSSDVSSTADTTLRTSAATKTRTAAETSTTTAAAAAGGGAGAGRGALTPFQKAGISVGVIGFVLVVVGVVVLFRHYRARKPLEHKRLSESPSRRDSWGYRFDRNQGGSGNSASDRSAWMVRAIHPSRDASDASSIESTKPIRLNAKSTNATRSTPAAMKTAGPASTSPHTKYLATPEAYDRASWRHSIIGLAISPAASKDASPTPKSSSSRPLSRLLPAKPLLALALGKKPTTTTTTNPNPNTTPDKYADMTPYIGKLGEETSSPKYTRVSPHPPVLPKLVIPERHNDEDFLVGMTKTTTKPDSKPDSKKDAKPTAETTTTNVPRESTMTEFEEDGRRSSSISPEGQIWRPPSTAPLSANAAYYVADKAGNWVLGNGTSPGIVQSRSTDMQGTKSPLSAYPQLATGVVPILPVSSRQQQPKMEKGQQQRQSIRVVTDTDSPLLDFQDEIDEIDDIDTTQQHSIVPRPLFSSATPGGHGRARTAGQASGRRSSLGRRSLTRSRVPSANSGITTFTFSDDENDGDLPNVQRINLSPVVESPWKAKNSRWLVSYPKIPGRETGPTGTSAKPLPPPRMPIPHAPSPSPAPEASSASNHHHHHHHHRHRQHSQHNDHDDRGETTAAAAAAAIAVVSPTAPIPSAGPGTTDNDNGRHKVPVPSKPSNSPVMKPFVPQVIASTMTSPLGGIARSGNPPWLVHNAAALRTGSPTMRLVRPSPEPEAATSIPLDVQQQQQEQQEQPHQDEENQRQQHQQRQRQQHHQVQQLHHQHHARPPPPGWIPGLPAHPHPQNRPLHTSTLWLPPQTRNTRRVETEPHHHELTPRRAQMDAQRSLSGMQNWIPRQSLSQAHAVSDEPLYSQAQHTQPQHTQHWSQNQNQNQNQNQQPWSPDSIQSSNPFYQAQAHAQAQSHHPHPPNPFHPQQYPHHPPLSITTSFPSSQPNPALSSPWLHPSAHPPRLASMPRSSAMRRTEI